MPLTLKNAPFWTPPLEEVSAALHKGLSDTYQKVRVSVVACPDLQEWGCAAPGMCGAERIVEVGGEPYAHNPAYRGITFDLGEIAQEIGLSRWYAFGAGIACSQVIDGHCGEIIPCTTSQGLHRSKVARVGTSQECLVEDYPSHLHGGIANVFFSEGKPGNVIRVEVEKRMGAEKSFPQALRNALTTHLDIGGKQQVALGGTFKVEAGKVRSHVMPDYECIPHPYYDTEKEEVFRDFLQFYEHMGPQLLCFTVLWTGDPTGSFHLRPSGEHTHFYTMTDKPEAGHYHYDVTPDEIRYVGYFNLAKSIHRVNDIYQELEESEGQAP